MYQLKTNPIFTATVTIPSFAEDGAPQDETFTAIFRRAGQAEIDQITTRIGDGTLDDAALVRQLLAGWREVMDQDGTPLAHTPENLDRLLDVVPIRSRLVRAYFDAHRSLLEKN